MIWAPDDVVASLRSSSCKTLFRLRWTLTDGSTVLITDRLDVKGIGTHRRSLAPFLGDVDPTGMSFRVRNDDGFFSQHGVNSFLRGRGTRPDLDSKLEFEQGVPRSGADPFWFPIFGGYVDSLTSAGAYATFKAHDAISLLYGMPSPTEFSIQPNTAILTQLLTFLLANTAIPVGDVDLAGSWTYLTNILTAIGWPCYGRLQQDEPIAPFVFNCGRSALGYIVPDESGLIKIHSPLLPRTCGPYTREPDTIMGPYNKTNCADFTTRTDRGLAISEANVHYQGVSIKYRDATRETQLGAPRPANVYAPFIATARQANWMARLVYESVDPDATEVVRIRPHGWWGLQPQLYDVARIVNPNDGDHDALYRISSKTWTPKGVILEARREPHRDAILEKDDWFQWASTTWADGTEIML